jgi:3-oxosteroid 1-dehydrogenase
MMVNPQNSAEHVDVVVVGGGAAGLAAANAAARDGAKVVVVDAGATLGGTTVKSSGGCLVFDNRFHREAGIEEDRATTLRLLARTSFPDAYDPEAPSLGLDQRDLELIEIYYDSSSAVFEELEREGTLVMAPALSLIGDPRGFASYYADQPEETIPFGRTLNPQTPDGVEGYGQELIRQLYTGAALKGVRFAHGWTVAEILRDGERVVGIACEGDAGTCTFWARRAVIFCTGGFTADRDLLEKHMPGYVPGGGAVSRGTGALLHLTAGMDVELAHMDKAWWAEVPVEIAVERREMPRLVFFPPGDSMIYVDRRGERVVGEKLPYDRRAKVHFVRDGDGSLPNKVLFMIWDDRVAMDSTTAAKSRWPLPAPGGAAPWVLEAPTLEDLASGLRGRLAALAEEIGGDDLDDDFATTLEQTLRRFNRFAESGRDEDFRRGEMPIEIDGSRGVAGGTNPNRTMYPISPQGPFYAMILAAGTLDTKGGPRIDRDGRILRSDGSPIPRLYGAGNCVASPSADAYWSGGATLGLAVTFGVLAGRAASQEPRQEIEQKGGTE